MKEGVDPSRKYPIVTEEKILLSNKQTLMMQMNLDWMEVNFLGNNFEFDMIC